MGPVLYFRGLRDGRWHLSALMAPDDGASPGSLRVNGDTVLPRPLPSPAGGHFWRYDFQIAQTAEERTVGYEVAGQRWQVQVPAAGGALRLAFTSCNGVEEGAFRDPLSRNERWRHLRTEHARRPFHLLLQGGDQLYADRLWEVVAPFAEWRRAPWSRQRVAPFTREMAKAASDFFLSRYRWLWSQPDLEPVLATIPSLMMWDDHDIFDNWGSYEADRQASPVFQGVWSIARAYFAVFQLAAPAGDLPEGFSDRRGGRFGWAFRIGPVGIIAPDLRSERTRRRVMDEGGWRALTVALDRMADCRHILLMSSVPVVHAYLSPLERLLRALPGRQSLLGDLRDQWRSFGHREEWLRLLRLLFDVSARNGARITVLSGEIHLGALGCVENGTTAIYQLTSAGVVHHPPPAPVVAAMDWISRRPSVVAPDVTLRMLPFPGLGRRRHLRARNWLAVEVDAGGGLAAAWHAEGRPDPFRYAIAAAGA